MSCSKFFKQKRDHDQEIANTDRYCSPPCPKYCQYSCEEINCMPCISACDLPDLRQSLSSRSGQISGQKRPYSDCYVEPIGYKRYCIETKHRKNSRKSNKPAHFRDISQGKGKQGKGKRRGRVHMGRKKKSKAKQGRDVHDGHEIEEAEQHFIWTLPEMYVLSEKNTELLLREATKMGQFVQSTHDACDDKRMIVFIQMLSIICQGLSMGTHISEEANIAIMEKLCIFDQKGCHFWGVLSVLIRKAPYLKKSQREIRFLLQNVYEIIRELLEASTDIATEAIQHLPLDDLSGTLKQFCDKNVQYRGLYEDCNQLLLKRDSLRDRQIDVEVHVQLSSENSIFAILPTLEELSMGHFSFDLQKNRPIGSFDSVQQYIETHYHLLREDFIHPLRNVIEESQDLEEGQGHNAKYEKVKIIGKDISGTEIIYKISFKFQSQKKTNWEHNKRFTYGSLLCLSQEQDNFQSLQFATVAQRDIDDLKKGVVTVKMLHDPTEERHYIDTKSTYIMFESPAYFEAYGPVLSCLKKMITRTNNLPMQKYLVECERDRISPIYLRSTSGLLLNMSPISKKDTTMNVLVSEEEFCSAIKPTDLDESQIKALHLALTSELALIQGPPGTGKTFVGIKLVEILLQNQRLWNPRNRVPIMVMCHTNHALDQFLEGILEIVANARGFKFDILRVGGRSKSERIKELTLNKELAKTRQASQKRSKWRKTEKELAIIECKIQALDELCFGSEYNSLNELLYYSFLHESEVEQLLELRTCVPDMSTEGVLRWFDIGLKEDNIFDEEMDEKAVSRTHTGTKSTGSSSVIVCQSQASHETDEKAYEYWKAQEDDRRIHIFDDCEIDQSKGSFVQSLVHKKSKLRELFKSMQKIPDNCYQKPHRLNEKKALFKYCLKKYLKSLKCKRSLIQDRKLANEEKEEDLKVNTLQKADIVGFTTTGASKFNGVISKLRPKIIIVEEAAEVMEGPLIASLTPHVQHLILIGDHKQLRPKSNHYILGKEYGLEISLFERLVNNGLPYATLKYQHRMRPEISELIHPHIYPELYDHESVKQYPNIQGMLHNIFFVSQHNAETDVDDLKSPSNESEAWFIAKLCKYLLQQGHTSEEITILTPYTGQVVCLKQCFKEVKLRNIQIVPVDHYQGEENEIILLSLVRNSRPGFVKEDNRVCVALSRAKRGFYCIGNFNLFSCHSPLWNAIVSNLWKRGLIGSSLPLKCQPHGNITYVSSADCFQKIKDGGCNQACGQRLRCGHMCPKGCHYDDPEHNQPCHKPCGQLCDAGLHVCPLMCSEQCKPCEVEVEKVMPYCGHKQNVPCYKTPEDYICKEPCANVLACGHPCRASCGEACVMKKCKSLVMKTLLCGHQAQVDCHLNVEECTNKCNIECNQELACGHRCGGTCGQCHQGRLHIPCKKKCTRKLLCGHTCTSTICCAHSCPPCTRDCQFSCPHGPCGAKCNKDCIKCREPCLWKCEHEQCTMPCGEPCNRPRCNEPCTKKLVCHHSCIGLCGEPCPEVCRQCDPTNEIFTIFLGFEDEPNAQFFMLPECKHLIEMRKLDEYMDGSHTNDEDAPVQWKTCPKCTTPITTCLRYANVLKGIKKDFNNIKKIRNTTLSQEQYKQMVQEVVAMNEKTGKQIIKGNYQHRIVQELSHAGLQGVHAKVCALSDGQDCKERLASVMSPSGADECNRLMNHVECLIKFVKSRYANLPQLPKQMYNDIHCERRRVKFLSFLYGLQEDIFHSQITIKEEDLKFINECRMQFNPPDGKPKKCLVDETDYKSHFKRIQSINRRYGLGRLTMEEVRVIVKALDAKYGSWYKCPNGHYYNIGECGGAMQEGRCIECKAKIGGRQHRLQEDNQHAGEVDGSRYAAWSEMANLENFEL